MPTPFARSLRSLEADGFRGVSVAFLIAGVLLSAWAAWFALARIAVYEVTERARVEVNQSVQPVDARVAGRVVTTHLDLGRIVHAGDVLVELDADAERLRLEEERTRLATLAPESSAVDAEIAAEQRALEAARHAAQVARDEARSQLAEAEAPALFAEEDAARLARLRADGLVPVVDELRARSKAQRRVPRWKVFGWPFSVSSVRI